MVRTSYTEPGVDKKPLAVRVMPAERRDVEELAGQSGFKVSKIARLAMLAGLPILRAQLLSPSVATPSTSPAADLSGGDASASSAGLSSTAA